MRVEITVLDECVVFGCLKVSVDLMKVALVLSLFIVVVRVCNV